MRYFTEANTRPEAVQRARCSTRRWRVETLILLPCLLILAAWTPAVTAQDTATEEGGAGPRKNVIPPGQEELLGEMLGRGETLAGCQLDNGKVDHALVKVVYSCPSGEVELELVHPSVAPEGATKTERFAIMLQRGTAPEGLIPALASRIRSKESTFEWKLVGGESGSGAGVSVSWVRLAVAALVIIAILGWIIRWRSGKKSQAS